MSRVAKPDVAAHQFADAALWKLQDAKARFSEVVRLAQQGVPQRVSVRGREAVVILSAQAYARLAPAARGSLAALFGEGPFTRLDAFDDALMHERTPMRDAPAFEP
jgi:prevent-host-death family protein